MARRPQLACSCLALALLACKPVEKKAKGDERPALTPAGAMDVGGVAARPGGAEYPAEPLPGYLLTSREIAEIRALVVPHAQPKTRPELEDVSTEYGSFRAFVEGLVNRGMARPRLSPGRTFAVSIIDADDVNAFTDAYQRIAINNKTVRSTTPEMMLMILCHEIAHSARNHAVQRGVLGKTEDEKARVRAADAAAKAYFKSTYDEARGVYVHQLAAYKEARAAWDKGVDLKAAVFKRQEAEADVVGMMICAELGMPPGEFVSARQDFSRRLKQLAANAQADGDERVVRDGNDLPDGEQLEIDATSMRAFLFPVDSHPSDEERDAQAARAAKIAVRDLSDAGLYAEWRAGALAASGGALMLTHDEGEALAGRKPRVISGRLGTSVALPSRRGCHE